MGVIFIDFLLLTLMILGIFLVIFSNSILWVWFGMEVLSLSIVMFLLSKDSSEGINLGNVKSMSLFKYMLLQFIGGVSLLGVLMMSGGLSFVFPFLLLKLGLVPFHSWVLDVYGSLSLTESYLLSVVPKLSTLILLEYTSESSLLIYTGLISVSMGVGVVYSKNKFLKSTSNTIMYLLHKFHNFDLWVKKMFFSVRCPMNSCEAVNFIKEWSSSQH